ncbi:MAG: iron-containing alcohol dehydrogenase [Clostridia bacterium]|nr:iron-containing alcohol dehydrogenase [Clostridia bacterium]
MDLNQILSDLKNCPCGREHTFDLQVCEIGHGILGRTAEILQAAAFPRRILLVADENTIAAADGILEVLRAGGFELKTRIYENLTYARAEQVAELMELSADCGGILSVGSGSLNDICRVASYRAEKAFCIFATAPSMDGFASDTAPILENNFKSSWQAKQPNVILGDTAILAAAPAELKAAGFGDMVGKYIGLVDWRIAKLLIDEYYCDKIAALTEEAVRRIMACAEAVQSGTEEAAGAVMEALVLTGLAMKLAASSRPASGAEHVISHYWECYKIVRGIWPEYHGKKVGVATVVCNRLYRKLAEIESVDPVADPTDWDEVYTKYDPQLHADVRKLNTPTITDKVDPAVLREKWGEIRTIIKETLPETEVLLTAMKQAGAATEVEEVHVNPQLFADGLRFHGYMRYRLLLTRLMPMLGLDPVEILAEG